MPKTTEKDLAAADVQHFNVIRSRPEQLAAIKYLYDRLGIIDNKTSALLRLNGFILGFIGSITVAGLRADSNIPCRPVFFSVLVTILVILGLAELLGLSIFSLKFDRLTLVPLPGGEESEAEQKDLADYTGRFSLVTVRRERRLASVLGLTALGSALFVILAAALALHAAFLRVAVSSAT